MPGDEILYELKENIGFITINRPKFMNAVNKETVKSLLDVLAACANDPACRVVVVTGAGQKAFSAGADINVFMEERKNTFGGREWSRLGQRVLAVFDRLGKPSIAAVDGLCAGGGCEIALACTFRIASEKARFGFPEVSVGILPGWGGTQRLIHIVGKAKTLELVLTGDIIGADEALKMGLVNRVVPAEGLFDAARELAKKIGRNAPLAVSLALEAINDGVDLSLQQGLILESNLAGLLCTTDDAKEGIQAFVEKREPRFKGK
ncbi:MAG: enoyl-CoA hydratase-related protein [Syntrophorhabdales bacterium]|jgi:enoyl-CoA hydratase